MIPQAIFAMKPVRALMFAPQRLFRAHESRNVCATKLRSVERITCGLLDVDVAGDGGDRDHVHGRAQSHDERDCVIGGNISVDQKGAPHINTFLVYVPSIVVPAGFTRDQLPTGITFLGRPYDDGHMIKLAYAYEQATRHRKPPASVTPL